MNTYSTYQEAKKEITVENFDYFNLKKWIENYSHRQKVELVVYCAELVVNLYTGSGGAPKKAIKAAKDWLLSPSEENKQKCKAAARAADTAAAAAVYAAVAVYAARYTADAAYAVYAAYAADESVKEKIVNWILSKYEQTETPEEKEALDVIAKDNEEGKAAEWDGNGLPPVGCKIKTKHGDSMVIATSEFDGGVVTYAYNNECSIACCWATRDWVNPLVGGPTEQPKDPNTPNLSLIHI